MYIIFDRLIFAFIWHQPFPVYLTVIIVSWRGCDCID